MAALKRQTTEDLMDAMDEPSSPAPPRVIAPQRQTSAELRAAMDDPSSPPPLEPHRSASPERSAEHAHFAPLVAQLNAHSAPLLAQPWPDVPPAQRAQAVAAIKQLVRSE